MVLNLGIPPQLKRLGGGLGRFHREDWVKGQLSHRGRVSEHCHWETNCGKGDARRSRVKDILPQTAEGMLGHCNGEHPCRNHNPITDGGRHKQGDQHAGDYAGIIPQADFPPCQPGAEQVGRQAGDHRKNPQNQSAHAVEEGPHKIEGPQGADHIEHHRGIAVLGTDVGRATGHQFHR